VQLQPGTHSFCIFHPRVLTIFLFHSVANHVMTAVSTTLTTTHCTFGKCGFILASAVHGTADAVFTTTTTYPTTMTVTFVEWSFSRMSPLWMLLELRVMEVVVTTLVGLQDVQSSSQIHKKHKVKSSPSNIFTCRCPSCRPTISV